MRKSYIMRMHYGTSKISHIREYLHLRVLLNPNFAKPKVLILFLDGLHKEPSKREHRKMREVEIS